MSNIKRIIVSYVARITLIMVIVILGVVIGVQILNEQRQARESSHTIFVQIEQILAENQKEITLLEEEYRQTCIYNAEGIAYIIQYHPSVLEDIDELKKIAEFAEVDEIHIFDKTGTIVMGTHPEYYGYSFDSGEQIGFFKPMLEDKTLKLVQDITPNTAEGKMMQYSAIWSENGEFIVQVGMEPVNVMKVTEKNELSYIFSLLRANEGVDFYAIDAESGEIMGSTVLDTVGKDLTEIGLDAATIQKKGDGFHAIVNGVDSYCIFTSMDGNFIGRVVSNDMLYQRIPSSALGLAICLILIAIILVACVSWYMNRFVISGIYDVNEKLRLITEGNLDETVDVQSSLEFSELSSHINEMVKSLLADTDKLSYVLNRTHMRIGVYEYNGKMKKVRFTEYIPQILALDQEKADELLADYELFDDYIAKLRGNALPGEEGVFCIDGECKRYVKIEEVTRNNDILGIVMDVTDEIVKRRQIEAERDVDLLTGLYNRRGLESKLTALFAEPKKLDYGALLMIDADGLKEINDKYGHDKGDIYLKKISEVINAFGMRSSVAARYGGDEFVLFLYDYDNEGELANTIALLQYIQENGTAYLDSDLIVPLKFSVGVSMIKDQPDFQELIKLADERMYENKRERKQVRTV